MAHTTLPAPVAAMLDGTDLPARIGQTLLLLACEPDGWPRMAMLSAGEVLATSDRELRLALYAGSGTTRALQQCGRALLVAVVDGVTYKIRLASRAAGKDGADASGNTHFVCEILRVDEDTVGYAKVEHGIEFSLADEPATLERWRRTVDRLRSLG